MSLQFYIEFRNTGAFLSKPNDSKRVMRADTVNMSPEERMFRPLM